MNTHVSKNNPFVFFFIFLTFFSACTVFSGRETTSEYMDDTGITAAVKGGMIKDPQLKAFRIHVETFQNVVQLSGFVDRREEAERAAQIAWNVQGVKSVKNNIVVRKQARLYKNKR